MLKDNLPVEVHEARINGVLAKCYRKEVARGREPIYHATPLDDLLRAEEGDEDEREKMLGQVLDYLYGDGAHPGAVLRRVYGLAKAVRPHLIMNMSLHEMGLMFGETRAAACARILRIFNGYLKKSDGHEITLPWQKSAEAKAKFSAKQKGNSNRRHGNGKAKRK